MTTPAQQKLIKLAEQKDLIKKYHEELNETIAAVKAEIGVGGMFQDPISGRVFEITEPDGKYVFFDKYSYGCTKIEGEARGTLSMKKAQEAGFDV